MKASSKRPFVSKRAAVAAHGRVEEGDAMWRTPQWLLSFSDYDIYSNLAKIHGLAHTEFHLLFPSFPEVTLLSGF